MEEQHGAQNTGELEEHAAAGRVRPRMPIVALALLVGGAALVLGVGSLGIAMSQGVGQEPSGEVDPGFRIAADFTLMQYRGGEVSLADYSDRPVLIYYWASWCQVCEQMSPLLQSIWPEYEQRGYEFLGINILDAERDALAAIDRHGMTFPNLRDEGGAVYLEYGVYGVPEFFFVRPGRVVDRKWMGGFTENKLREMLDELSAETIPEGAG